MITAASTRIPALDGLRGVAILLVLGFHLPLGAFRSGSYGVVLFFVLSGYLITTILLRDLEHHASINFRHFYRRRALRLLPALALVAFAHFLLLTFVFGEPEVWWSRTWPSLFYVANLVQMGGRSLVHLGHTWSLAVEEHFYFLWPLLLTLVPPKRRFTMVLAATAILACWRIAALAMGLPNLRISFGTDTNAFAPLLGCLIAIGIHDGRFRRVPSALSTSATTALIAVACLPFSFTDRRVLWGSLPVAALCGLAVLGAVRSPAFWLEGRALRWFGTISYGLYLWHYMLISLPWERWTSVPLLAMVASSIGAAYLSWRFIEAPILEGRFFRRRKATNERPRLEPVPANGGERLGIEGSAAH